MRNILLAGAAALALTGTAQAQDSDPTTGFNQVYVGGSFGGSFQPNDGGETLLFSRNGTNFSTGLPTAAGANAFSPGFCGGASTSTANRACTNDRDDIEYMGRIGADAQFGRIVIGVVGEFGRSELSDSVSGFSTTPANYTLTRDLKYNGNVRGRLGFTPNDTTLFYGTGGAAYGRLRNTFVTSNAANTFTLNGNQDAWGYTAGGGVEQKIGRNFSIGLEYLYTSLQDEDTRVAVGQGTAPATNPFVLGGGGTTIARSDPDFNFHSIRATVAFRF